MKAGDVMKMPEFDLIHFDTFGIHTNPRNIVKKGPESRGSWVTAYELKFFKDDFEGGAVVNGVYFPARDGCFLCVKPGQSRRMIIPYRCYRFHLTTRDPQLMKALDALPTFAQHPEMPRILELCKKACYVDQRSTLNAKFEIYSYVTMILTLLLRQYPDALVAAHKGNVRRHEQALLDADNYLRDHCDENIDLVQVAKDSGLHPTYFQKLFTEAFGSSPAQKLITYRIGRARGLLHDDNRPISEIARMCGFSYQSYFCRVFKRITKQTPSQYRQSLRKRRPDNRGFSSGEQ